MDKKNIYTVDVKLGKKIDFEITDSKILLRNIPITGELVQEYESGFAYKPLDEVKNMDVLNKPIIFMHPSNKMLAEEMSIDEIAKHQVGVHRNPSFRKNNSKKYSDMLIFRSNDTKIFEEKLRNQEGIDVSVGFKYDLDTTSGVFDGKAYDYVQRNIRHDHTAILLDSDGQVHAGRAPFPDFGIGADQKNKKMDQEKYDTLVKENSKFSNDMSGLKVENDALKKQSETDSVKITELETKLQASDEKMKSVDEKLKVFVEKEKTEVDSMREELGKKMPVMKAMFDKADVDSIKKTFDEFKKVKSVKLEGNDSTSQQEESDADIIARQFSTKKEEVK